MGFVFYEGPSQLDGKPVVAIATENSKNRKTGNLIQTWIVCKDVSPIEVMMKGKDSSVCGNCKLRKSICYVALHQAPLNIWRKYKRGEYPKYLNNNEPFRNQLLRIGSYGDCVAIPYRVWANILKVTRGHTSYSHSWSLKRFQKFKNIAMASCDSESEALKAQNMGWRTFRVKMSDAPRVEREIVCPASRQDLPKQITCSTCLLCDGTSGSSKNIVEDIHGIGFKVENFRKLSERLALPLV